MNNKVNIEFDEVFEYTGQFGAYQWTQFILLGFMAMSSGFNIMGIVFLAATPDHWCSVHELDNLNLTDETQKNLTIPYDTEDEAYSQCDMYNRNYTDWTLNYSYSQWSDPAHTNYSTEACTDGWEYDDSTYSSTTVTEWDLVCDKAWVNALSSSLFMLSLAVAGPMWGSLADKYGRRTILLISCSGMVVMMFVLAFSPTFATFTLFRFLLGMCGNGVFQNVFILYMEMASPSWRTHLGVAIEYWWVAGYLLYVLFAYFITDWRYLQIATSIPMLLYFFIYPFIYESARWLYLVDKREKADSVIKTMARKNKRKVPDNLVVTVKVIENGTVMDTLKTSRMRWRTFNLWFSWFVVNLVYYGLSLNTSNLGGNDYANFFISAAVEIPAYILSQVCLVYLGRRWPMAISMILGGVALLCTIPVPSDMDSVIVTLSMIGKFFISGSFAIIYVFTAELYPTLIRNVGLGMCCFVGKIGSITAPFMAMLGAYVTVLPLVIFGSLALIAGLLDLLLPETNNENLPETLEDGENFGRDIGMFKRRYSNYSESSITFDSPEGIIKYNEAFEMPEQDAHM